MMPPRKPEDDPLAVENAEAFLWETISRILQSVGEDMPPDALKTWLQARPESLRHDGGFKRIRFALYHPLADYLAEYNARTGEQMSWRFSVLREGLKRRLDEEVCLDVAREAAQLPADAVLKAYGYEDIGNEPVFSARWSHIHQGLPVEGDYIEVFVNGETGKAYALHRKWHQIDMIPSER